VTGECDSRRHSVRTALPQCQTNDDTEAAISAPPTLLDQSATTAWRRTAVTRRQGGAFSVLMSRASKALRSAVTTGWEPRRPDRTHHVAEPRNEPGCRSSNKREGVRLLMLVTPRSAGERHHSAPRSRLWKRSSQVGSIRMGVPHMRIEGGPRSPGGEVR
jgi:hypothetical protein